MKTKKQLLGVYREGLFTVTAWFVPNAQINRHKICLVNRDIMPGWNFAENLSPEEFKQKIFNGDLIPAGC